MKTIEITTTQNVTIEYALGTLGNRIIAFVIDFVIMFLTALLFLFVVEQLFPYMSETIGTLIVVCIFFPYTLLLEYFNNGQSIGKKMMKLKVIRIDGENTRFMDYFTRWSFRFIDIYFSLGSLASMGIISSTKNQKLGDLFANTTVVKLGLDNRLQLKSLLALKNLTNYTPVYPEVMQLEEKHVLTIQETLNRQKKYPNYVHKIAVERIVSRLEKELGIQKDKRQNEVKFLQTLIKDYVVLTR